MARRCVEYHYERVDGCCPVCNFKVMIRKNSYSLKEIISKTAKHIARKDDEGHREWKKLNNIPVDANEAWKQLSKIQKILEKSLND